MYFERIESPADLKRIGFGELTALAAEARAALIEKGSACGGHLASNLGAVELTIALHYAFDAPTDKIVFDVSHQTYTHKMLTGRTAAFIDPAHYGDVSGYTFPEESEYDLFSIGHTSTSLSLALGLAFARDAKGGSEHVVAVIGDSSLDGGESFEALNLAGELGRRLVVVVNDNDMSIPENHGALAAKLGELRRAGSAAPDNYFRSLGLEYSYVADGHNVMSIVEALNEAKLVDGPTVVHVRTTKGKGYGPAETDPEVWHWAHPFDVDTGKFTNSVPPENYGAIVREHLLSRMAADPSVVVVAASTPLCIGFNADARRRAGGQYIDAGIAEQNAVAVAAGLAKGGMRPVFATNSTFYQRAYDQIAQEVGINSLPVTMIVTHASVLGHTNDTHAGLYDMALLGSVPNLVCLAPANCEEYLSMLDWSLSQRDRPVAIRVPWTGVTHTGRQVPSGYATPAYQVAREGSEVAVLALGGFFGLGERLADEIERRLGFAPTLVNPRYFAELDEVVLRDLARRHKLIVTMEDGILRGGFGSRVSQFYAPTDVRVLSYGFPTRLPNRYRPDDLMEASRLTPSLMADDIEELLAALRADGEERG